MRLTEAQRAVVDADPEAVDMTFGYVLRRLRARHGFLVDIVVDAVRDWYHRAVVACARRWDPTKGRTWRSYLLQNAKFALKGKLHKVVVGALQRIDLYRKRFVPDYNEAEDKPDKTPKKLHRHSNRAVSVPPAEVVEVSHPALKCLTDLERSILLDRYGGESADTVGRRHGRNRDWCRRIESNALKKLGATK